MATGTLSSEQPSQLTERQAQQREAILRVLVGEVASAALTPAAPVASAASVSSPLPVEVATPPRPTPARRAAGHRWKISLPHGPWRQTYTLAAILFVPLLVGALWVAVYEVGVGLRSLGTIGSAVPLPAGSVDGEVVFVKDLVLRARGATSAGSIAEVQPVDAFASLRDELLIRHELARRGAAVGGEAIEAALGEAANRFGSERGLLDFVKLRYGWNVTQYRESIVRPHLERERLAATLAADRTFSVAAWEEAERAAAGRGTEGLEDLGWLTVADLSPETAQVTVGLELNVRSGPLPTPTGLVVLLVGDRLTDDDGIPHWHLWRSYVPLEAVEAFLEQVRPQVPVRYFLPR